MIWYATTAADSLRLYELFVHRRNWMQSGMTAVSRVFPVS